MDYVRLTIVPDGHLDSAAIHSANIEVIEAYRLLFVMQASSSLKFTELNIDSHDPAKASIRLVLDELFSIPLTGHILSPDKSQEFSYVFSSAGAGMVDGVIISLIETILMAATEQPTACSPQFSTDMNSHFAAIA